MANLLYRSTHLIKPTEIFIGVQVISKTCSLDISHSRQVRWKGHIWAQIGRRNWPRCKKTVVFLCLRLKVLKRAEINRPFLHGKWGIYAKIIFLANCLAIFLRCSQSSCTEFNTTWMQRSFSYNAYSCVSLTEVVARKSNWKKELKNKNRATLLATQTLPVSHLDLLQVFRSIFNFSKMNSGLSKPIFLSVSYLGGARERYQCLQLTS